jgi:hypothetical protein
LRAQFNKEVKPKYWMDEAAKNPGKYTADDLVWMGEGKAPIGNGGFPMEPHHKTMLSRGGSNDVDNLVGLTRTEHRPGENYAKNHPRLPR